ncbi:hypothetical protein MFFDBJGM_01069 [Pectobacterium versatile]|nr:hypothetical protein MFFDBJGM_01069 [Pectobacterium versatile]
MEIFDARKYRDKPYIYEVYFYKRLFFKQKCFLNETIFKQVV